MKEVRQFDFIINVIPNGLEEYMSFNINDKFIFIDILFLSSSLDSLVKKGLYLYEKRTLSLVKKDFISMSIEVVLKSLKTDCLVKKCFVVRYQVKNL